ncbi:hypothetical protein O6B72_06295 [Campylobacter ureolyticus]|uniref:hypothetical protein n=1 Tax=Campylobacter ureolyticus TaxID=827 RepID=UPI0022B454A8|nr:hypothetical protein [Campylobacter ureolyticus]MCZ6156424.1 hypothetical protein [Campylobacter ureolyticus]
MPLPFVPLAAVLFTATNVVIGAKKGYDAIQDSGEAKRLNRRAEEVFEESQKSLDDQRKKTNSDIKEFGEYKIEIFNSVLLRYFNIFEKIKNIEFENSVFKDDDFVVDMKEFEKLKTDVLNIKNVIGGGVASLGAGALAGFGAYGGVGLLATASTGTAISTLSGAAATNATLAWLGGGSLASGGLGMAGGTMVLGGLVAGPALAVAGWVMASSAEKAKNDAYTNLNKARAIEESNKTIILQLEKVSKLTDRLKNTIEKLVFYFNTMINNLDALVDKNDNYKAYDEKEKTLVHHSLLMAQSIKNLISVPLMDEKGEIEIEARKTRRKAERMLEKIIEIDEKYK